MNGLYLLEEIEMNDLDFRPPDDLIAEMERLHQLEQRNSIFIGKTRICFPITIIISVVTYIQYCTIVRLDIVVT